jgi:hypothetical protein
MAWDNGTLLIWLVGVAVRSCDGASQATGKQAFSGYHFSRRVSGQAWG